MAGVYIEGLDFPKDLDGTYRQYRVAANRAVPEAYVFTIFVDKDGKLRVEPWDSAAFLKGPETCLKARILSDHGVLIDADAFFSEFPELADYEHAAKGHVVVPADKEA